VSVGQGAPLAVITYSPGELPDSVPTAVYIAHNSDGGIIYVGITGSLASRFAAHKKADLWWSCAASIEVEMWPDRPTAAERECTLIAQFDPPHNRVEKRRGGWAESRRELAEAFLPLYEAGLSLAAISERLAVGYPAVERTARDLRAEGRIAPRPHWTKRPRVSA
jgi:hypothetical protein